MKNRLLKTATLAATLTGILGTSLLAAPAANASPLAVGAAPDPSKAYSTTQVRVGDHVDTLWLHQISTRNLELDGKPTRWNARYDLQIYKTSGDTKQVLFEQNLTVYKVNWLYVHFKTDKHYTSDAAMLSALAKAFDGGTETAARAEFRDIYGGLGKFRTKSGKLQAPQTSANYNAENFSSDSIAAGDHRNHVRRLAISPRTFVLDGKATDSAARYNVQVKSTSGASMFDRNFSVYRLAWFDAHFDATERYASDASMVAALEAAANVSEVDARAAYRDEHGSLGQFRTSGGELQDPQRTVAI